ncbi:Glycosyl transferase family 1 [Candidatus Promineifilum breve]|uniref:Glycosyl transferase family 1 n=1 Tax=Candidatus Promineifilum breve TaxID=1806508 RepID=A0A160T2N9_9CHLR|nr:glycosyltransferase [Candidatus Promineifilum breve]CUS03168.2 Glycosyl transferase family 1 [Candidatus Promineifilum breve]
MRIGMVSATYDAAVINGAVRMVTLYKTYLEELGHEVTIFTLGEASETDEATRVIRSPGLRLGHYGYYLGMSYTREAQALLAGMDIVHCHHLLMSVEMAHRYARCPIIYTNHTRYDLYTGAYTPLPQPAADAIMRQVWPEFTDLADVVIAPSEGMRQVMVDFGVRARTVIIENGIDLEPFLHPRQPRTKADFGLPETARLLLYVGRLAAEKDVVALIRQFVVARGLLPELQLALIGQGPQEAELKRLVAEQQLGDCVHFRGVVAYDEVGDWLAAADAFVTASTSEVHPLTVIEAMAAGKPIAAVRSPGIADTVESGVTGYLADTPDGLDAAIVALLADPARARAMGEAARAVSLRFDIRRTVARTVELYEELLAERPDLSRDQEHGRWSRRTEKWGALLDQLADIIRPADEADAARDRPGTR